MCGQEQLPIVLARASKRLDFSISQRLADGNGFAVATAPFNRIDQWTVTVDHEIHLSSF
jgi:hypothetical protein